MVQLQGVCLINLCLVLAVATVSPLELVRTRTQALTDSNFKALQFTLRNLSIETNRNGIRYLWKGLIPTLWRDVPFSALYWLCYESTKLRISKYLPSDSIIAPSFFSGLSSGAFAALLTTPFDVAKTRRQVLERRTTNLWSILCEIHRNEGIHGLFKGI